MSRPGTIVVADDPADLAYGVAAFVVAQAESAIAERGVFTLALAGGSTPKAAYDELAGARRSDVDWTRVRFFFGDERCVGPTDAESNYRMAHEHLLGPLAIPADRIARMRGEDDPPAAAAAYARMLRTELGDPPRFDVVMLGMGPDGHTASLFPGTDPTTDDAALVRATYVAKLDAHRLTLTPSVLNAARAIVVATAGDEKAAALRDVLEGPVDPTRLPIQILDPRDGELIWLVDRDAAALLHRT